MNAPFIHKNAGPPPPRRKGGRKRIYHFDQLAVGDALFIPLAGRKIGRADAAHNSLRTAATVYAKRYAPTARFEVRVIGDRVGCWRVE